MAILNYSKTYQEVLNDFEVTRLQDLAESNVGDYIKLFFDGEGNILTHGVNYTPLFFHQDATITRRGLVPVNTSGNIKEILRGNGSWAELATSDLPIWESGNYDADTILNSQQVNQLVQQSFIANEAMRFKGVVDSVSDIINNTDRNPWKVGDTYRIKTPGQYFGKTGEVGDLLICVTAGTNTDADYNMHWAVVQSNIDGVTTVKLNNSNLTLYAGGSNVGQTYQIWGPTTNGYGEQKILVTAESSNGAPIWAGLSEGLSIARIGSGAIITLGKATTDYLGGVKIDSNNGINGGSTISVNSDGTIYLTTQNIINALGYKPADPSTLQDALSLATRAKDGLAPMFDELSSAQFSTGTWLLGVTKGADSNQDLFGWYGIPETAFKDTWRKIIIGNVDIEDSELHINPSDDVCVKVDNNPDDDIVSISFGLSWYNISTGAYETA